MGIAVDMHVIRLQIVRLDPLVTDTWEIPSFMSAMDSLDCFRHDISHSAQCSALIGNINTVQGYCKILWDNVWMAHIWLIAWNFLMGRLGISYALKGWFWRLTSPTHREAEKQKNVAWMYSKWGKKSHDIGRSILGVQLSLRLEVGLMTELSVSQCCALIFANKATITKIT